MNHERDGNDLELRGVRLTIPDGDKRRTLLDVPRLRV